MCYFYLDSWFIIKVWSSTPTPRNRPGAWLRRGLPVAAAAFHAGMGFCRCFSRWGGVFCRSSPLPPVPGRHSGCLLPGCLLLRLGLLSVSLLPHSGILSYPCSSPAPSFARLFRAPGRPCRSRIAASRCVPPPSAPGTSLIGDFLEDWGIILHIWTVAWITSYFMLGYNILRMN